MIYCVEDDQNIRDLLVYVLHTGGFEAKGFPDAESFYQGLKAKSPRLILLDIMLPGEDGLSILKKLKNSKSTRDIPVVMLTAKGAEYDKVLGLDGGADDYVTKPFGVMELLSRVRAVLRRTAPTIEKQQITIGKLSLSREQHHVSAAGQEVFLTNKEFELLGYLMENQGIVISRDKLLEKLWGYEHGVETRTVDVHIRGLRQKLGGCGELIETVRGVGYRIGGAR
jgi:two-component system, OmpR family, alkaline phosphatase synthesis response regulator PhoP